MRRRKRRVGARSLNFEAFVAAAGRRPNHLREFPQISIWGCMREFKGVMQTCRTFEGRDTILTQRPRLRDSKAPSAISAALLLA